MARRWATESPEAASIGRPRGQHKVIIITLSHDRGGLASKEERKKARPVNRGGETKRNDREAPPCYIIKAQSRQFVLIFCLFLLAFSLYIRPAGTKLEP